MYEFPVWKWSDQEREEMIMTRPGRDVEKEVAGFGFLLQIRGKLLAAFEQRAVLFSFSE